MIFSSRDGSAFDGKAFGVRGAATKAALGLDPASTMPNYSVIKGAGQAQPTYNNTNMMAGGRNPQSISDGTYQMKNTRFANQDANRDAPTGIDQVWQVIDNANDKATGNGTSERRMMSTFQERGTALAPAAMSPENASDIEDDDEINEEYFLTRKGRRDSFSDEEADPNRNVSKGEMDDLFNDVEGHQQERSSSRGHA